MMIKALTEEVEDLGLTGRDVNEEQDAYTMMMMMIDDNDGHNDGHNDDR